MRISQDTLTKLNRSSIELADGSGDYWGSLEVYHHLHCLVSTDAWPALKLRGHMQLTCTNIYPGNGYMLRTLSENHPSIHRR